MTIENLVQLARSPDYEDRRRAAAGLAAIGPGAPEGLLHALLNDDRDTAVVEEAALGLLRREDQWGLDLLLGTIAELEEDELDLMMYFIARAYTPDNVAGIGRLVQQRTRSSDPVLRESAKELLEVLPWPPPGTE